MELLSARNLTVPCGARNLIENVSFALASGEWLMLTGPNGAGKSTLINAVSQCRAYTGTVLVGGKDARAYSPRQLARKLGVLMQGHAVSYAFTVEEVVRLGRYAYREGLFTGVADDDAAIERALGLTGLDAICKQSVLTLSGGELQRVFLAQLFAQDPEVLLLDEPTNHLDIAYQKQTFELIRGWIAETGRAVLSAVHDLSIARAYGTHALLLDCGRCAGCGAVDDVLTQDALSRAYGVDVYEWMRAMLSQWDDRAGERACECACGAVESERSML